jgi:hypothetical protein
LIGCNGLETEAAAEAWIARKKQSVIEQVCRDTRSAGPSRGNKTTPLPPDLSAAILAASEL